jgi:hypothetical protein
MLSLYLQWLLLFIAAFESINIEHELEFVPQDATILRVLLVIGFLVEIDR